jgi:DNA repair exonuclease SbcCD nuclease subunit
MNPSFRFIHASDLHLDRPLRGLTEVPDHLRDALVDAPYLAAERVFDAAIRERVDFVVLAGDVLDPLAAGPRGLVFLDEHFEKLRAAAIRVYWSGGRGDHFDRWPEIALPANVVRFPLGRPLRVVHERDGAPIAQILGTSATQRKKIAAGDFHVDPGGLFALAVAYGSTQSDVIAVHSINYWALGGEHQRRTLLTGPVTAHYCGTPQGRRPAEAGPRGCTLVHIDETLRPRLTFIPTDAVRYQEETVPVGQATTSQQLHEILDEHIGEMQSDPFGPDLLIQWTISGSKSLAAQLSRGTLATDLTARLRAAHAAKRPAAWTISIDPEPAGPPPADRYEEQTVLGEFLRTVRHYVEHGDERLDLDSQLSARHAAGNVGAAVALDDPAERQRVLAEVARLGVELLSPEEPSR